MDTLSSNAVLIPQRGVYPPSFCRWRLLLAVVAVTQISVLLIAIGMLGGFSLLWLGVVSLYAQSLALVTAMGLCITQSWLARLSARGAWLGSWLMAIVTALAFSYSAGIVGTVLGAGPGRLDFSLFVLQSVLAVALVSVALFATCLYVRSGAHKFWPGPKHVFRHCRPGYARIFYSTASIQ